MAVVSNIGWCWVPPTRGDVYWAPGYVGWYRTGSHVGWTPLAPGETFYGRRHYGRNSVNITTVNVNTSTVVYRNRSHHGGLTVMPHNDFQKGRPPANNSTVAVRFLAVGGPRIQPTRETRMPIVKQTPPRVAPPRSEYRDARELRNRYPRVTPVPAATVPPAVQSPDGRTPRPRETRPAQPTVVTGERKATPVRIPREQDQQREDRRQRPTPQPAAAQTVPPVPQGQPPVSGSVPQRAEQMRRATAYPAADRTDRLGTGTDRQATSAKRARAARDKAEEGLEGRNS